MLFLLLLSTIASATSSISAKHIWLQSVQFNTFCGIHTPNFYLNARTSSELAETASVNLEVSFPSDIGLGLTYEIGEGLFLWKHEIEHYQMTTMTLTIFHQEAYESDPEIAAFTVDWDQIQVSSRDSPILLPVDAIASDCSVESAPGQTTPSAVIYLFAEDCSSCPTDPNGRLISSSSSNNDSSDNKWQITLVITLACAVVLVAVAVPAYFCMFADNDEGKDIELAFSEDVKMRIRQDEYDHVGYDDREKEASKTIESKPERVSTDILASREDVRGSPRYGLPTVRFKESKNGPDYHDRHPKETFNEEDERYSHYSYSHVTVPNSAHSNQSGGRSAHQKSFPQAVPMQMNPPPQAAGYVVNTPERPVMQAHIPPPGAHSQPPGMFVVNTGDNHRTAHPPSPTFSNTLPSGYEYRHPQEVYIVNNPQQPRMVQTSPHMMPMTSAPQPTYISSVAQPQPQYIVQQPQYHHSVVQQPTILQQPPTIVSQHSSLFQPQQAVQHVVMQRPQYVVSNQI